MDTYTSWEIYKAVYAVFVRAYDRYESTPMIRAFGSDANPDIWAGEHSGDPAVYSRFKEIFLEEFPSGKANPYDALDVIERFLKEMEGEYAFAKVAPGEGLWHPFDQTTNLLTWEAFFEEDRTELAPKVLAKDELSLLANLVGKKIDSVNRRSPDCAECPVCGNRDAHLLMRSQGPEFRLGTIWAWCDTCRSYAHASCHVPDWRENPGFLELGELCSNPDYPSRHTAEIDEWVNAQAAKHLKEQR